MYPLKERTSPHSAALLRFLEILATNHRSQSARGLDWVKVAILRMAEGFITIIVIIVAGMVAIEEPTRNHEDILIVMFLHKL